MKAHIAKNQYAKTPTVLMWNLAPGDRGKLDGMAEAFGMRTVVVTPADAGKTVGMLLGGTGTAAALPAAPASTPALLFANFREKDFDTLLDLCRQAEVIAPLKCVATETNMKWTFAALLAHLEAERAAYEAEARK